MRWCNCFKSHTPDTKTVQKLKETLAEQVKRCEEHITNLNIELQSINNDINSCQSYGVIDSQSETYILQLCHRRKLCKSRIQTTTRLILGLQSQISTIDDAFLNCDVSDTMSNVKKFISSTKSALQPTSIEMPVSQIYASPAEDKDECTSITQKDDTVTYLPAPTAPVQSDTSQSVIVTEK